ncbi:impB/mucB/samB family protein [Mycobacterium xenopi 4042]|uniref:ImpB/mucB/samB family protein n=1 Tax=Mycobacterium xenopi 4042 TaxID=1299334 RepID=X8CLS8_MYCXE|nr:impB/mucB/samB family protein [Mycobacterium xenopi 4042]
MFEVFRDTTPLVEAVSVDEAFLDVAGLHRVSGAPVEIAARLRADVRDRVGLPITVGVARTKFLAKVASQQAKPDGLLVVPPDRELAFLHPLPVRRLWGVGTKTAERLHAHGIDTVADVAELSESMLASLVAGRWATGCMRCRATSTAAGSAPVYVAGRSAPSVRSVAPGPPCRPPRSTPW